MKKIELSFEEIVLLESISQSLGQYPITISEIKELLNKANLVTLNKYEKEYDSNELPNSVKIIVNSVSDELSDEEKVEYVRFAYIQLGREFSYDEKFYILKDGTEKKQLLNKMLKDIIDDKVVCRSNAKMYLYSLIAKKIKARIVFEEKDEWDERDETDENEKYGHAYVVFEINGKKYKADLTLDLKRIKCGFKTKNFMKASIDDDEKYSTISEEELRRIDNKINYTSHRNVYGRTDRRVKKRNEPFRR